MFSTRILSLLVVLKLLAIGPPCFAERNDSSVAKKPFSSSASTPLWKRKKITTKSESIREKQQTSLRDVEDTEEDEDEKPDSFFAAASAADSVKSSKDKVSVEKTSSSSSALGAAIALALRHLTPERCFRMASLVGACWVAKSIWKVMEDVIEEFYEEATGKEEHDLPLFSSDHISAASDSLQIDGVKNTVDAGTADGTAQRKGGKKETLNKKEHPVARLNASQRHLRDLVLQLHAAGLPLECQVQQGQTSAQGRQPKTAESVLRSLTRAEGQMLANCLLTPDIVKGPGGNEGELSAWDSIGGLSDVKEGMLDLVYPLQLNESGSGTGPMPGSNYYGGLLSQPPGVLLFGPPGCGKTMLARALASTAGARFLCISPSSLLRKFVGETNLNVRALFSLARKLEPCVIFVDEMDGLFRERQSNGYEEHDHSRDLKTEFMQLWDGIGNNNDACRVVVMGSTNRPFDVDSAFLRRMPCSYFVGLPDFAARVSVLRVMLNKVPLEPNFDFTTIAQETEGYSPSDLKEVLRTAALVPLREARSRISSMPHVSSSSMSLPPLRRLTTADVLWARSRVAPTQFSQNYRSALAEYANRSTASFLLPQQQDVNNSDEEGTHTNNNHHGGAFPSDPFNRGAQEDTDSFYAELSSDDDEMSESIEDDDDSDYI
mmetsp:Transcript_1865/g.2844  ORF Transcript_1865/g.2844 Transcript_1865/m.2844 type:complete len:661 (+) Transcript_1865:51-2033(+)